MCMHVRVRSCNGAGQIGEGKKGRQLIDVV